MGTSYNANIVTDGLVLCLDAANPRSYPGSGTAWYDLSGNGNNGTLVNSPTFSFTNRGVFDFDGTNDYVACGNLDSYLTGITDVSFMTYVSTDIVDSNTHIIAGRYEGSNGWEMFIHSTNVLRWGGRENTSLFISVDSSFQLNTNRWYFFAGTKQGNVWNLYVDGDLHNSTTAGNGTTTFVSKPLSIGRQFSSLYWNGQIANSLVYNRALSANEVKQNFNATRGRYGI
jgi:hypothetical protein